MASCGVLGAGAWGTALALVACRAGLETTLWGRDAGQIAQIREGRINPAYLLGVALPAALAATTDLSAAARADFILAVVPAQALRAVASALALVARPGTPVVVCAKGIERASGLLMSEVAAESRR